MATVEGRTPRVTDVLTTSLSRWVVLTLAAAITVLPSCRRGTFDRFEYQDMQVPTHLWSDSATIEVVTDDVIDMAFAKALAALWNHRSSSLVGGLLADQTGYQARAGIVLDRTIKSGVPSRLAQAGTGVTLSVGFDSAGRRPEVLARSCLRVRQWDEGLWALKNPRLLPSEAMEILPSEVTTWQAKGWTVMRLFSRQIDLRIQLAGRLPSPSVIGESRPSSPSRAVVAAMTQAILEACFYLEKVLRAENAAPQLYEDRRSFAKTMQEEVVPTQNQDPGE